MHGAWQARRTCAVLRIHRVDVLLPRQNYGSISSSNTLTSYEKRRCAGRRTESQLFPPNGNRTEYCRSDCRGHQVGAETREVE
jgi:hypothetical protein